MNLYDLLFNRSPTPLINRESRGTISAFPDPVRSNLNQEVGSSQLEPERQRGAFDQLFNIDNYMNTTTPISFDPLQNSRNSLMSLAQQPNRPNYQSIVSGASSGSRNVSGTNGIVARRGSNGRYLEPLSNNGRDDRNAYLDMIDIAKRNNWTVTSGKRSRVFNRGSVHQHGGAIDVRSRGLAQEEGDRIIQTYREAGYRVLDERVPVRGVRQTAPHIHIEAPRSFRTRLSNGQLANGGLVKNQLQILAPKVRNRGKQINQMALGGELGEMGGALVGQALIPIPGIGSMIGAIGGKLFGSGIDRLFGLNKDPEAQMKKQMNDALSKKYIAALMQSKGDGSSGTVSMARGGRVPARGTGAVAGSSARVLGPSHEQGGVPLGGGVEVEGGETIERKGKDLRVFSDRLIVPNTNMTFAQAHELLISKNASKENIDELFNIQQQMNGNNKVEGENNVPVGKENVLPQNTSMNKKMDRGGLLDNAPPARRRFSNFTFPIDPVNTTLPITPTLSPSSSALRDSVSLSTTGTRNSLLSGLSSLANRMFTNENIQNAIDYAPGAINIVRGLFGKRDAPKYKPVLDSTINDGIYQRLRQREREINYDITPEIQQSNSMYRNIAQGVGNSPTTILAAQAQNMQNLSRLFTQKRNVESEQRNAINNQIDSMVANQSANNTIALNQSNLMNFNNQLEYDAERKNLISSGLNQLASSYQLRRKERQDIDNANLNIALRSGMLGSETRHIPLAMVYRNRNTSPEMKEEIIRILMDNAGGSKRTRQEVLTILGG